MNIFKIKKFILAITILVFPTSIFAGSGHYHYDGPDISGAKIKIFGLEFSGHGIIASLIRFLNSIN